MSVDFCVICNEHVEDNNWRYKSWGNGVEGWGCSRHFKPTPYDWTPESVKEDRVKYARDLVQPYREGEFSSEFKELYPEQAKGMVGEGAISQYEYDHPKNTFQLEKERIK